jgi:hypothetical protein
VVNGEWYLGSITRLWLTHLLDHPTREYLHANAPISDISIVTRFCVAYTSLFVLPQTYIHGPVQQRGNRKWQSPNMSKIRTVCQSKS